MPQLKLLDISETEQRLVEVTTSCRLENSKELLAEKTSPRSQLHLAHAFACALCSNLPLRLRQHKHDTRTEQPWCERYRAEYMDETGTVIFRNDTCRYLHKESQQSFT